MENRPHWLCGRSEGATMLPNWQSDNLGSVPVSQIASVAKVKSISYQSTLFTFHLTGVGLSRVGLWPTSTVAFYCCHATELVKHSVLFHCRALTATSATLSRPACNYAVIHRVGYVDIDLVFTNYNCSRAVIYFSLLELALGLPQVVPLQVIDGGVSS